MEMKYCYIVVPGLNDHKLVFKQFFWLVKHSLARQGREVIVFSCNWEGQETYQVKLKRLQDRIHTAVAQKKRVVLIGVSAGASLSMLAFEKQPEQIAALISVSGLITLDKREKNIVQVNRAWYQAALVSERVAKQLSAEQKRRVMTFSPKRDAIIDPTCERLAGADNRAAAGTGHLGSIIVTLLTKQRVIEDFVAHLAAGSSKDSV